jgi:hypothetical protein
MRSLFLHRYFDNEQPVSLQVVLQDAEVTIADRDSGILLGTLGWANNSLAGDTSFLPEYEIYEITRRLILATTRVAPVYVEPPEEEEEEG